MHDNLAERTFSPSHSNGATSDDADNLVALKGFESDYTPILIAEALKNDRVVLVEDVDPADADNIASATAQAFGLLDQLKMQAALASFQGHRDTISTYFMTVDKRSSFDFVPSHSEGRPNMNIQLASFYCFENSTDGGVTILQNTNQDSPAWTSFRDYATKVDLCGTTLSRADIARAKAMFDVAIPDDILRDDDVVLRDRESPIAGVRFFFTLSPLRKAFSRILNRHVYACWGNGLAVDTDSRKEYAKLLQECGLLLDADKAAAARNLDPTRAVNSWASGIRYKDLFKARIVRKLRSRDLVIFNNLTWTHSASNWTPGSGVRKLAAAFA